jgi:hypothetical protein
VRLVGTIRPIQTAELEAVGHDRASAYDALAALVPDGHELLEAHFSMKSGVVTAKGVIRPARTEQIEAEGPSYEAADAALRQQVPEGYVLLGRTVVS